MNEIAYVGEHLLPGSLGRTLIYFSLLTGLLGLFFYIKLAKNSLNRTARLWGRVFYSLQTAGIIGIGLILFYLIFNHFFEYAYVFKHSSRLMPDKFIISSFWAGQEGSFLLWAMFIGSFGIGAMLTARRLEGGVMLVVLVAQLILVTMLLGVHWAGFSIGSDPFILLRNVGENMENSFFRNPAYLQLIMDGNGLNPLLENPWMVIHPPMLFMGYASAIFPYAYAMASLMEGDKRYWLKPTLPWLLLAIGLLGIGLIMGGAWAYQSLTFGGFWAWDPVENASLVPWLVMVAALHYMLLSYKRDKYYYGTYIFVALSFIMVIYASYLTRSGVLGETSVHAFGDDGRSFQLISFLLLFTVFPVILLIKRRKVIKANDLPDFFSREFLMLYGAIVLLLAAFQVISTTSLPVFNKLLGTKMAAPTDVVNYYNTWQMPFALLVGILLGIAQYVAYGRNDFRAFLHNIIYPVAISLVVAVIGFFIDRDMQIMHAVFLFSIVFVILSSLAYLLRFTAGRTNTSAGITHLGFGLFLLGVLLTFANVETLSREGPSGENTMLIENEPKAVGDYFVNYSGQRIERDEVFHQIDFLEKADDGEFYKKFTLEPTIKYNSMMGNVHNPDTRNMLRGDVYMFITFAEEPGKTMDDGFSQSGTADFSLGDTLEVSGAIVSLDSLYITAYDSVLNNLTISASLSWIKGSDSIKAGILTYTLENNFVEGSFVELNDGQARLKFENISQKPGTIEVGLYEKQTSYIVVRILYFPYIILLWIGSIIMFIGITLGVFKRSRKARIAAE
ncbi:MAG: cytochrome c biogenesis protein CcsA [Lentimicrobiaceae bacterium]|nr:cytochrome c biogenesis protein CcsA [Lentimicrobiaceae bacterium]